MTNYLSRLRELCKGATPGPWSYGWIIFGDSGQWARLDGPPRHGYMPEKIAISDARFIAASREAMPKLLDALEESMRALERVSRGMTIERYRGIHNGRDVSFIETLVTPETESAREALAKVESILGEERG